MTQSHNCHTLIHDPGILGQDHRGRSLIHTFTILLTIINKTQGNYNK